MNCTLRTWLNGTLLQAAFSAEEQKRLQTVTVSADKNDDLGYFVDYSLLAVRPVVVVRLSN